MSSPSSLLVHLQEPETGLLASITTCNVTLGRWPENAPRIQLGCCPTAEDLAPLTSTTVARLGLPEANVTKTRLTCWPSVHDPAIIASRFGLFFFLAISPKIKWQH